jgi:hypothetical protein
VGRMMAGAVAAACLLAVALGPAAGPASAQGLEVLRVAPGGGDSTCVSPCASIQGAVERGSQDLRSGAAGSLVIEVAPGFYSGDVRIPVLPGTQPVTIEGAGPSTEVGGLGDGPAVTVPAGSRVAITDLSITGGRAASGGGVNNAGTLTLQRVTVFFNSAAKLPSDTLRNTGLGGGIFNTGSLTLQDSTVSQNQASVAGGGIENDFSGILSAARDAIVNNTVGATERPAEFGALAGGGRPSANGLSHTPTLDASGLLPARTRAAECSSLADMPYRSRNTRLKYDMLRKPDR